MAGDAATQPDPRRTRVQLVFRQPVPRCPAAAADRDAVTARDGIRFRTAGQGAYGPADLPMTPAACLGIVDWGIGGIGLVRELDRRVPGLPVLYRSDAGATPYGRMRSADLTVRLYAVVSELARRGATEVALAC